MPAYFKPHSKQQTSQQTEPNTPEQERQQPSTPEQLARQRAATMAARWKNSRPPRRVCGSCVARSQRQQAWDRVRDSSRSSHQPHYFQEHAEQSSQPSTPEQLARERAATMAARWVKSRQPKNASLGARPQQQQAWDRLCDYRVTVHQHYVVHQN